MNNLRTSLKTIFKKVKPQKVLEQYYTYKSELTKSPDKKSFIQNDSTSGFSHYNYNEVNNIYYLLTHNWMKHDKSDTILKNSIFNILLTFTKTILIEKQSEPFVKFRELLRWRDIALNLGEDILTTSYFAYNDIYSGKRRRNFSWKPIISTDNIRLKNLLEKGVAENHFHLKGSAPHVNISWIALMNHPIKYKNIFWYDKFNKLKKQTSLSDKIEYNFDYKSCDLYKNVKKATYIRALFFYLLNDLEREDTIFDDKNIKKYIYGDYLDFNSQKLVSEIDSLKHNFAYKFLDEYADYFIYKNPINQEFKSTNIIISGERRFLYLVFKKIYKDDEKFKNFHEIFYTYLLIKDSFRDEFIQTNKRLGFENFQDYQNRKSFFIIDNSIYERALYYMAVNSSLKNQTIKKFETRIAPKDSLYKLDKAINKIDNSIYNSKEFEIKDYENISIFLANLEGNPSTNSKDVLNEDYKHFYNLHFIKLSDKPNKDKFLNIQNPRNYKVREKIKSQTKVLFKFRELSFKKNRILGIDAASSEIDCRPEVFGQIFRALKEHFIVNETFYKNNDEILKKLRATYHVGEDFLDILDGLRAIDEAIKFLNLSDGDRLGHALALGLNIEKYYEKKQSILLLKQDLLDNIAWMLAKIRKYNINSQSLVYNLTKEFNNLFNYIYGDSYYPTTNNNERDNEKDNDRGTFKDITPDIYFDSWKLRGDAPELYSTGKFKENNGITYLKRNAKNKNYPKDINKNNRFDIRENREVSRLYYLYHFNPSVEDNGNKIIEFDIYPDYIKAVSKIQHEMQKEISKKHIGIETNPTSNYLISSFDKYSNHPILNFYNLGLTYNHSELEKNPQLFISINTDDQGVFNTYLENEYALLAIALEKERDKDGNSIYNQAMIYDWLDRIREMGLEMSFL